MENITLTDDVQNEKFKYIIENTILEFNRVLHNWELNDKKPDYNDRLSLFRSYFAKFFKQKFSWIIYNQYIRNNYPLYIIDKNKLINIDLNLSELNQTTIATSFNKFILLFDFIKFNDLHQINDKTKDYTKITNLDGIVDYEKLENITF